MKAARRKGTSPTDRAQLFEKLKSGPKLYQSDFNPSTQLYEEYARASRAMHTPKVTSIQAALTARRN